MGKRENLFVFPQNGLSAKNEIISEFYKNIYNFFVFPFFI